MNKKLNIKVNDFSKHSGFYGKHWFIYCGFTIFILGFMSLTMADKDRQNIILLPNMPDKYRQNIIPLPKTPITVFPTEQKQNNLDESTPYIGYHGLKNWPIDFFLKAKADLNCRRGDPDCNRCTGSVVRQFNRIKTGQANWKGKPWRFNWGTKYRPYDITPYEAFDNDDTLSEAFGISVGHPQGFVRTNSSIMPYAGSHSMNKQERDKPGTIFIIRQDAQGRKYLSALHRTHTHHPSGVHILGKYIVFGERPKDSPNELRLVDINAPFLKQNITHSMPKAIGESRDKVMFGGGIGIVRLSKESYLLISSLPGDNKGDKRYHQFYHLQGKLNKPSALKISFINEQTYKNPTHFSKDFKFSENLSLISECNTGDIYAIHSTGDGGKNLDALIGGGYWRLSKLKKEANQFQLQPMDVFEMSQNATNCHMRSAASVGVAPNGKIEMLCHQYRKDPDPSLLNPIPIISGGNDKWNFTAGTPQ